MNIVVDGAAYRICGYLNSLTLLVMDAADIGRVLVRDTPDGPWRLMKPGGDS